MEKEKIEQLLSTRWEEVQARLLPLMDTATLSWDIGDSPLFRATRCNASTTGDGGAHCHVRFCSRLLEALLHRVDGVTRHELGHVIDFVVPYMTLDSWAQQQGVWLPTTPERRADAIAALVWGEPILYDTETVQSMKYGVPLRPEHLGL